MENIFTMIYYHTINLYNNYDIYINMIAKRIAYIDLKDSNSAICIDLTDEDILKLRQYLKVSDYEKYKPPKNHVGYLEGEYINFEAISNDGYMYKSTIHYVYDDKHISPYEKLLSYIKNTYFSNKKYHINL